MGTALLRLPASVWVPPGWFPLVVDRVDPYLHRPSRQVEVELDGARLVLDLEDPIQRRIFYLSYERHELAAVRRLLRPGDAVVVVGAHVGLYTIVCAQRVGVTGAVHAFEPIPANHAALERNVALNRLSNVTLNRSAVGREAGSIVLGLHPPDGRGRAAAAFFALDAPREQVQVPMVSLSEYLGAIGTPRVRLVKIDVEGMEPDVLQGLEPVLQSAPPDAMLVEVSAESLSRAGRSFTDITGPLRRHGYASYRFDAFGRPRPLEAGHLVPARAPRPHRSLVPQIRDGVAERASYFHLFAVRRS